MDPKYPGVYCKFLTSKDSGDSHTVSSLFWEMILESLFGVTFRVFVVLVNSSFNFNVYTFTSSEVAFISIILRILIFLWIYFLKQTFSFIITSECTALNKLMPARRTYIELKRGIAYSCRIKPVQWISFANVTLVVEKNEAACGIIGNGVYSSMCMMRAMFCLIN